MKRIRNISTIAILWLLSGCTALLAQAPVGPITPLPGTPVQQAPPQAQFRVQVSLVNTPVTVRNSKGQMIHDLDAKDFRVTDNGVEQKILHFDLGTDPLSLVILVENSSRIAPMLPQIRKTGIVFTQVVMGPNAEAAVVSFNDSIDKLQDFTTNADAIEKTIGSLAEGTSGSKLYDAMSFGVEMLTGRPEVTADNPGHRRVLMILSEASDVGSEAKLGEILRRAQTANVTIYSVGLSTTRAELQEKPKDTRISGTPPGVVVGPTIPGTVATPDTQAQQQGNIDLLALAVWAVQHADQQVKARALELAAEATGGEHLATFKDRSIEKAIDEIGGELHSQYVLTYTPSGSNDSGYHEIKVEVDRKGLKVRSRPGYYLAVPAI
jgi:VWFA-related protein